MSRIRTLSPGAALILYYAAAIFAGAILLATPLAAKGAPLSFLDAFFTATSAQCVTGLIVVDTGARFTLFGQIVILALIQIGGLGITTFSVYLFLYLKVGVGLQGRWIIHETLLHTPLESWKELIREIVMMSCVIEAIGAVVLSFAFVPRLGWWPGLFSALFHSVSAFCNAGFSLFPDSLISFRASPLINGTIMALIFLGGIGFLVIREVLQLVRRSNKTVRLSLHSRVVLLTSVFLIIGGAFFIGCLEAGDSLSGMSFSEGVQIALFQSVSARTAGFNSIDLATFRVPTLFLLIFLMFIGASPGSAGGGVKTTSLALFFAIFYNRLKGSPHTSLFRRTIPDEAITKAFALVLLAIFFVGLALFALLIAQSPDLIHEDPREFLGYIFETVSAFATVGLSIGSTAKLNVIGKIIIILLMFVGRVGLLTIAFAIAGRTRRHAPRYAEENIMIG